VVVYLGEGFGSARFIGVLNGGSLGKEVEMGVVEVVGCVAEGIDF